MRLLAVTAVTAEYDAVLRHLGPATPNGIGRYPAASVDTGAGRLDVVAGGVGMAASAAATATALALASYEVVVSLGVAGGFDGRAGIGEVVVADQILAADLGVDAPDGYRTLGELGLADTGIATGARCDLVAARLGARTGLVLTVTTVTGTDERAAYLRDRWGPVAEAMEGYGVWSAARTGAPDTFPLEVRAISNRVGRRDRDAWDLPAALDALARASARLFEEPVPLS